MFKSPTVALNAKGFLHKFQTKKEHELKKEFQVIPNLLFFEFSKKDVKILIFKVFYTKHFFYK